MNNKTDSAFITRIGGAVSQFLYHARQTAGLSADDLDGTYTITFDHGDLLGIEKASVLPTGDAQAEAAVKKVLTKTLKDVAGGSNPASAD